MAAERRFSHEDQLRFARAAGDWNPLHVDPVHARRLLFGGPVAHGVHAALWALDVWASTRGEPASLERLKVSFRRPVLTGESVSATVDESPGRAKIAVRGRSATLITVDARFRAHAPSALAGAFALPPPEGPCDDPTRAALVTAAGEVPLAADLTALASLVPHAARVLPAAQLVGIATTGTLVGTRCPGRHSLFGELEVSFPKSAPGGLAYRVTELDDRVQALTIELSGALSGHVRAFLRPAPRDLFAWRDAVRAVQAGEFTGQRALVVGGSRGMGQVAAALLAAGGASVRLSYRVGKAEAEAAVADLCAGGAEAGALAWDVSADPVDLATALGSWVPTHLYYFPTPPLHRGAGGPFSRELFERFAAVYVTGFSRAVEAVLALAPPALRVYLPSTVALDELPDGMIEYTTAKAAAECLARVLQKAHPELSFRVTRLPRVATDLTASLLPGGEQEPVPVVLAELRAMA